jgi:hypothetical protein
VQEATACPLILMEEPEVVCRVHRHLVHHGIGGQPLARLFTDPHPTLTPFVELRPFQRFAIGQGDLVAHPDLLGQEAGSESLIAIEAKGSRDLLKGLAQAELFQDGVQRSFLAAPASALGENFVLRAREKGIGILAVGDGVQALHVPQSRRPLNDVFEHLVADLSSAAWVAEGGTFNYNLPTHYLVWVAVLPVDNRIRLDRLHENLSGYPMPNDWRSALRGAQKLGLVRVDGAHAGLTDIGEAARGLLPDTLAEWAAIHRDVAHAPSRLTLIERCTEAGHVLRLLLLSDPIVRLVLDALRTLPDQQGNFVELARACWQLDRRKAVIFFLKPEATGAWVSRSGEVDWGALPADSFRSTTFYQYKSVLKHAGLIAATQLGGASSRGYDPSRDAWCLGPRTP